MNKILLITDLHGTLIDDRCCMRYFNLDEVLAQNSLITKTLLLSKLEERHDVDWIMCSGGSYDDMLVGMNLINYQVGASYLNKSQPQHPINSNTGFDTYLKGIYANVGGFNVKNTFSELENDSFFHLSANLNQVTDKFIQLISDNVWIKKNFDIAKNLVILRDELRHKLQFNIAESSSLRAELISTLEEIVKQNFDNQPYFIDLESDMISLFSLYRNKGDVVRALRKNYDKVVSFGNSLGDFSMFMESDVSCLSRNDEVYHDNYITDEQIRKLVESSGTHVKMLNNHYLAGLLEILTTEC